LLATFLRGPCGYALVSCCWAVACTTPPHAMEGMVDGDPRAHVWRGSIAAHTHSSHSSLSRVRTSLLSASRRVKRPVACGCVRWPLLAVDAQLVQSWAQVARRPSIPTFLVAKQVAVKEWRLALPAVVSRARAYHPIIGANLQIPFATTYNREYRGARARSCAARVGNTHHSSAQPILIGHVPDAVR